jgi:hypothetical protein
MDKPAILDPETLELITKLCALCAKNPDFLNLSDLHNYSNLPISVQRTLLKEGYICPELFVNNRIPNELVIESLKEYFSKKGKATHIYQGKKVMDAVIGYNDINLLKDLAKIEDVLLALIKDYPGWKNLIGAGATVEALQYVYAKYSNPRNVINQVIQNVYLDEESIDLILNRSSREYATNLFGRQFLAEAQLVKMGWKLYHAWKYYPLSNPEEYQPNWTNKGDRDMISPNMPDDWAEQIITSKKDVVIKRFALFGPTKYLPLLIGKEAKRKWHEYADIVQARLFGNKELIWEKVFKSC